MYLSDIKDGQKVKIIDIHGCLKCKERLFNIGLAKGSIVDVIHIHKNGPCLFYSGKTKLVLGHSMSKKVEVELL